MRELNVKYKLGEDYRHLFTVTISTSKGIKTYVGISKDGMLLYKKATELNIGSGYWIQEEFYEINKTEFRDFIRIARLNENLDYALSRGKTTEEELERLSK